MPYTKIWIHSLWAVKNRKPLLKPAFRYDFFQNIRDEAAKKNIYIDHINGYVEHIHCLIGLKPKQTVSETIRLIKGGSSHWFDKQSYINKKFYWQSEYYTASVSPTHLDSVRTYIQNQENHHKNISFEEELRRFIKINGLE